MPGDVSIGSIPTAESPAPLSDSSTSNGSIPQIAIPEVSSPAEEPSTSTPLDPSISRSHSNPHLRDSSPSGHNRSRSLWIPRRSVDNNPMNEDHPRRRSKSIRRAISASVSRASGIFTTMPDGGYFSPKPGPRPSTSHSRNGSGSGTPEREESVDVAGPRFHDRLESMAKRDDVRTAGESSVYANGLVCHQSPGPDV